MVTHIICIIDYYTVLVVLMKDAGAYGIKNLYESKGKVVKVLMWKLMG
jgi:hypothetical protein